MMSHYDRLGTTASASADELHQAYRSQANRLHPDKHAGRSVDEQADAEREMQRLNEAWHVLSDAGRRRLYDETLAAPRTTPPAEARPRPRPNIADDSVRPHDPAVRTLVRLIPLGLVVLALVAVLVFAAAALGGRNPPDNGDVSTGSSAPSAASVAAGDCILVERGRVSAIVPCEGPNDGRVTRRLPRDDACVGVEQRVDGPDGSSALCVVPTGP